MRALTHTTHQIAWRLDLAKAYATRAYRSRVGYRRPLRIQIYRGYGSPDGRYRIGGRVIAGRGITPYDDPIHWWRNAAQMARRFLSPEVPFATVRIHMGDRSWDIKTDDEGYFWFEGDATHLVESCGDEAPNVNLYPIQVELRDPEPNSKRFFDGHVQLTGASLGVISDIDDTIIASGATDIITLVKTTLAYDATRRRVFAGIGEFYRALGPANEDHAVPFWYVSSSAWNLYDFFEAIWRVNSIPQGSYLLRDLGVTREHLFKGSHEDHKLEAIRSILSFANKTNFILVGDTGQRDPYIYAQLAAEFPNRVEAIYLREVTGPEKRPELDALGQTVTPHAVWIVSETLEECVSHAISRDWCSQEDGARVVEILQKPLEEEARERAMLRKAKDPALFAAAGLALGLAAWGTYALLKKGKR